MVKRTRVGNNVTIICTLRKKEKQAEIISMNYYFIMAPFDTLFSWVFKILSQKKPGHIVRKTFRCSISLGTLLSLRVMERLLSKKVQKMMISLSLPSKVMHVLSSRPVHPKEKMQTSEWSSRIVRKRLRYEFLSVKHESQKAFQRISFLYWIPTVFFGQLRSRKKVLYLDMPHFNHNVLWLFFVI